MRLTDGRSMVEISMRTWSGEQYSEDFSEDFFADGKISFLPGLDAWLVDDVEYCVDYATDWEDGTGDFYEDAEDPEVVNGNRRVDVKALDLPPRAIYAQLSDTEFADLVTDHALAYEDGLSREEMSKVSADDIKMFWEAADVKWTDVMLDNMSDDELVEFSEAIARRVNEDAEDEADE